MTKILFYESRPEWGGAQSCELELIIGLENFGYKTLFLSSSNGPMVERLYRCGKKVHIIPISKTVDHIRKEDVKRGIVFTVNQAIRLFPHLYKVLRLLIKEKIDIVYTSQFRSQLVIGWLAKFAGKKVIWHIHGEEKLNNVLGKFSVAFADEIIVVSEALNNSYKELFPRQKSKFKTVHNGVDIDPGRVKHKNNYHYTTITTVGTLVQGKRQGLVIEACARLIKKGINLKLNIVGEKPHWHSAEYQTYLHELVDKHQISQHVHFLGWVENPIPILQESDLFVLPSDTEGMPLSIIEAMATGLPCIASNVGGVPELIEHGWNGFIINPGHIDELVYSIQKLMENPKLLAKMGENARNKYAVGFTKQSFLRGVEGVITPYNK